MIYVTGYEGMLGQAVIRALHTQSIVELPRYHGLTHSLLDITNWDHVETLDEDSTVINCAGITKAREAISFTQMVKVNSYGPILLAERVKRLVQVSTDCVFSGDPHGLPHSEQSRPSPQDFYGRTKLAGEPPETADTRHLVVRGSFIGFGPRGLLTWLLAHEQGATVNGYVSWSWTGHYVRTFARILVDLALDETVTGVLHIPGPSITKFDLLKHIAERIRPDLTIVPKSPPFRDMRLRSGRHDVWRTRHLSDWDEMLEELDGDYRSGAGWTV